jgi:hypothetical protein
LGIALTSVFLGVKKICFGSLVNAHYTPSYKLASFVRIQIELSMVVHTVIPVLWKLRQEDSELETSQPRPHRVTISNKNPN